MEGPGQGMDTGGHEVPIENIKKQLCREGVWIRQFRRSGKAQRNPTRCPNQWLDTDRASPGRDSRALPCGETSVLDVRDFRHRSSSPLPSNYIPAAQPIIPPDLREKPPSAGH